MKAVKLKMCTLMVSYKIKHYHKLNEKTINTYTKRFFVEGRKQGNEYVMFFCLYYMYEKKNPSLHKNRIKKSAGKTIKKMGKKGYNTAFLSTQRGRFILVGLLKW